MSVLERIARGEEVVPGLGEYRASVLREVRSIIRANALFPPEQSLYFIQARSFTIVGNVQKTQAIHIKIGISKDPLQRMRDLQCGTHAELSLLGRTPLIPRASAIEAMLHRSFAESRTFGEWFCLTYHLYAVARDLTANPAMWVGMGIAA